MGISAKQGLIRPKSPCCSDSGPGEPSKSELIRRIKTSDPDDRMPPPDHHRLSSQHPKQYQGGSDDEEWRMAAVMNRVSTTFLPVPLLSGQLPRDTRELISGFTLPPPM
ncbi:MAG: c-type cytochrome domain-containing protein [Akkermansiaceae bacterium]